MEKKIAIATVDGKAFYLLVRELKKRNEPFLTLRPHESIPASVAVVITTSSETERVRHSSILTFDEDGNPAATVDEALRLTKGKRLYERLVVGVDPGRNFGVAALGDGVPLEARNCPSPAAAADSISEMLARNPAVQAVIRIGNGASTYVEELLRLLTTAVPENVAIESVEEGGTSKSLINHSHRRGEKDLKSAIKIGQKRGRSLPRRKKP
jgi:hypothetical protein